MLKASAWIPGTGLVADPPREKFAELMKRDDVVLWLDIEAATPSEIAILRSPFNIHPTAIDECRDYTALPKVENFDHYLLVILHRIQFDPKTREVELKEIDFLLGKNWLITVRQDSSTSVDDVQRRLQTHTDLIQEGPARLMAEIVEVIMSKYLPMVEFLEKEIDVLEEAMLTGGHAVDAYGRILSLRHTVVALRRSLVPQREVIQRLSREEFRLAGGSAVLHLREAHDELYWILTELEIHRELLTSAFEGHAAMAANRLAEVSNRMNRVMEKLSRFATIFMPLTLVTGIYGMNFEHMPELHYRWSYPLLLCLIAGLGFALAWYFRKTLPAPLVDPVEEETQRLMTRVWRRPSEAPKPGGMPHH
ncbi:MAG: magnesium/cobalt transporter CorA [Planctomycetes bacterium]|nr:magnesium/cobalt transporter CorA [Planctomycetota bacterium]